MKIFNVENNQLVAYIQQKNLKAIVKHEDGVPKSVYKLAKSLKLSDLDETHDEEFVRIQDKKIVEFIKKMYWIPDYRELRDLSDEELSAKVNEHVQKLRDMHALYMSMSREQQMANYTFPMEYAKKNQTIKDINAYLWTRQGTYSTPITIPLALDGMAPTVMSDGTLRFGASLDGKQILIEKQNGGIFADGQGANPFEIQSGIMILIMESGMIPTESGEVQVNIKRDPSKKYLIASHSFEKNKNYVPPVKEEQVHQEPTRIEPKQMKKSFFQRVFQPKQKDEN